jgi:hypothetical protein
MYRFRRMLATLASTLAVGGSCLQIGGCDVLGSAISVISDFNPCGTLLVCDPAEYEFITSGIDGPGVEPELDPFCVYPPFCSTDVDPIFGGLSLYGP